MHRERGVRYLAEALLTDVAWGDGADDLATTFLAAVLRGLGAARRATDSAEGYGSYGQCGRHGVR